MKIGVVREASAGETRAALVPESVRALITPGVTVHVESGVGAASGATDGDYVSAGAQIENNKSELLNSVDLLVCVNRPADDDIGRLKPGAVVIGFLRPLDEPGAMVQLIQKHLTAFAMELVPRSTRAQSMDALSSMATIVGYKAVLLAAERLPRMFPLLMTAAGTIAPA